MLQIIKENPRAALIALLMHLAIILFMIVGVDWLEQPQPARSTVEVVQARVVDQSQIDAQLENLKREEIGRQAAIETERRKEQQKLDDLKRRQEAEQARLAELEKRRRSEEEQRLREQRAREQQEQKRVAEERRHKEAEEKRRVEEAEKKEAEEAQRRKAAAEQQKRKEAEEAKLKAEAEKKRQAEAAARKAAEEKRRKAEAARKAREAELEAAMQAEHNARVTERYMLQIQQKINNNWVRLEGTGSGLKCTLRVRLAKGGNVIAVSVIKSSGSGAFDRSAEAAVYKAEPLPVPDDGLFEKFRDINFVFEPNR